MTSEELELAKIGLQEATQSFTNLIRVLFGGAAREIGGMLEDSFRARRIGRLTEKILPKIQEQLRRNGIEPRPIPDNIWVSALEAATLTDDSSLQDRWATLLANAATPSKEGLVQPSFVEILSHLSPREAKLLDVLFEQLGLAYTQGRLTSSLNADLVAIWRVPLGDEEVVESLYFAQVEPPEPSAHEALVKPREITHEERSRLEIARGNLLRNQLIEIRQDVAMDRQGALVDMRRRDPMVHVKLNTRHLVYLTALGFSFVRACRSSE